MNNLLKASLCTMLILGLGLSACKRENADDELFTANDHSNLEAGNTADLTLLNDALAAVGTNKTEVQTVILPSGAVVTLDSNTTQVPTTYTLTIDFGTTGLLCQDGRTRKGKLISTWSGQWSQTSFVRYLSSEKYFVNGHQFLVHKTVSNLGRNSQNQLQFGIDVHDTVLLSTGGTALWNSNRSRTWVSGEGDGDPSNDIWHINGSANGVNRKGTSFTASITQTLVWSQASRCFTAGEIEVTPSGKPVRTITFGNGSGGCQSSLRVRIGTRNFNIAVL